jgi:hypothetical protein
MKRTSSINTTAMMALLVAVFLSACSEQPDEAAPLQSDEVIHFTDSQTQDDPPKTPEPLAVETFELPADWPSDVELAPYMLCASVSQVRGNFMVSFHAPDKSLTDVVDWFTNMLVSNGWSSDGDTINDQRAILAYSKGDRTCGITIMNFVLDASMQRDDSTMGITIQTKAQP